MTIFRHRVTGNLAAGDIWECTLHSQSDNALGTVHAAWHSAITTFLTDVLAPMWNTHTASAEVVTDQLDLSGLNVAQDVSAAVVTGSGTGGSVPQGACILISWLTAKPTRSGRGRMFLPGPDDTHVTTSGLWVTADALAVSNGAVALLAAMNPETTPVLYGRLSHVATTITGAKVNTKPSFQRRRLNKVDNNYQVGS